MSKYFTTTKKGEIHDLKEELSSPREDKKTEAVKKIIAAMTEGKDVSVLFTDVVNCMQTHNIELKKLVYLYVMNYAKSKPDLAILAVNTFQKDASDPNPLIRALAVRTLGCIRVDRIVEYLTQPLAMCLKDQDPYVRKTAAVCVAKLFDINPELVVSQGFLDQLKDLLADANPMVVANAVAALNEINEVSKTEVFKIDSGNLLKLLAALNECTEWGQVFILDSLAKYVPRDAREAEMICERVTPRLNHSNSAVVLSAVKVVLLFLDYITTSDTSFSLCRKLGPPLITLLSNGKEPEIHYVALRNINLIVQKRPEILQNEIKVFVCKYNDPIYVKMEKLEIMIMLANERNIDQLLPEFKEYANMVDVEFVRKSVRAIGRCAIKLEAVAERCIQVLLELIQTKVNYVVQEAVIVIKDIFRKYPNRYEAIIATLCENLDSLDEPEAKASMIWIVGEYAERIENADVLLESFLENFADESAQVQLQLLTAAVKLFLRRPKTTQEMVQRVLNMATQESENPDLRDRGFIYWRLLSSNPEAAKGVVLADKPLIKDTSSTIEPALLNDLVKYLATLASVYHKPPESFVSKARQTKAFKIQEEEEEEDQYDVQQEGQSPAPAGTSPAPVGGAGGRGGLIDLLGMDAGAAAPAVPTATPAAPANMEAQFFTQSTQQTAQKDIVLPAENGAGMELRGAFMRRQGQLFLDMTVSNRASQVPISQVAVQFNKNSFGVAPAQQPILQAPLYANQTADLQLPCACAGPSTPAPYSTTIQVAVKNNSGQIYYFAMNLPLQCALVEQGMVDQSSYLQAWRAIPDNTELVREVPVGSCDLGVLTGKLRAANMFEVARLKMNNNDILYMSCRTIGAGHVVLMEVTVRPGATSCTVALRSTEVAILPLVGAALATVLK
eukprot:TRINITY_DN2595_c0_g1_i1.p1 TRINITY_DN2595_c0_g1~~TRINITY_DN2595_c0_g1_i1.p1  ORF type:complete len:899 (-),score=327.34 TRINITY_DN2595_c0_g1_i1:108-2804(-)